MNIYSSISQNKFKTWLIMFLFVVFIATILYVFGRATGGGLSYLGFGLVFATLASFGSFYYSDKLVLTISGARRVKEQDSPALFRVIQNLSIGDGLPMPEVYMVNDASPNAFATGRSPKHASLCVTTGLLEKLTKVEIEGVIAHELSHVRNLDTRLMAVVAILVGFVAIIANFFMQSLWFGGIGGRDREDNGNLQFIFLAIGIIFAILSPVVATLIQLAVSRKREFLADASGALLTRYPEGLASALEKISRDTTPVKNASNATAHLYIANPFKGRKTKVMFSSLFDTHPPIEERIKILRSM